MLRKLYSSDKISSKLFDKIKRYFNPPKFCGSCGEKIEGVCVSTLSDYYCETCAEILGIRGDPRLFPYDTTRRGNSG